MAKSIDSARGEEASENGLAPDELAAHFLAEQSSGASPAIEGFLARLPDERERREFRDLVDGATRAARGLPRTLAPGSMIAGRYRITDELGVGGMGKVYAARDEKLGRSVAVKVLAPLSEGNREREEMFDKEWRILAELNHPGIVAVHDAGSDGHLTYIVMDLVDGTAVSDVIERARAQLVRGGTARNGELLLSSIGKPPSPGGRELVDPHDWSRNVARIVLEIARTLEAAHGKGVIHRDLKPANVMLLGGGTPIVLDFGLAGSARVRAGETSDRLHGSLPYVAPEQVLSEKQGMDPRTDVYQAGLILYELLTLKRPFSGTESGDLLRRIRQGYFDRPRKIDPSIPRDLEAICMKALEVDLGRRYPSAKALREDLEAWLEGRAPVASSGARWRSLVRTMRYTAKRHPTLVALAGMLLVAMTTWSGFRATDPGRETDFFRMVPDGGDFRIVPIRDRKQEVAVGDLIGFTLRSAGDIDVYALSVYGSADGSNFVSPWKATDKSNLNRIRSGKANDESWGFHVPDRAEPVTQIVCEELRPQTPANTREGLLVLVAHREEEKKKIEFWMNRLMDIEGAGADVRWNDAVRLLTESPPVTRGKPTKADLFDRDELEKRNKALLESEKKAAYRLGLPNVDEYSIECRVAGT